MKKNMENMNENREHSIINEIQKKIASGSIAMRPRWHFLLRAILAILGLIIFLLASLFTISFLLFVFRNSRLGFIPYLGVRGIMPLILSLPWILIITAIIFILVLEVLVKRYSFAYKKPLSYSLLAIVILVFFGSFIVLGSSVHDRFLERAEGLPVPGPVGRFYKNNLDMDVDGIYIGSIHNFGDDGFVLTLLTGEEVKIATTSSTRIPPRLVIEEGDEIIILTEEADDLLFATDIRKLPKYKTDKIKMRKKGNIDGSMKLPPPGFNGQGFGR